MKPARPNWPTCARNCCGADCAVPCTETRLRACPRTPHPCRLSPSGRWGLSLRIVSNPTTMRRVAVRHAGVRRMRDRRPSDRNRPPARRPSGPMARVSTDTPPLTPAKNRFLIDGHRIDHAFHLCGSGPNVTWYPSPDRRNASCASPTWLGRSCDCNQARDQGQIEDVLQLRINRVLGGQRVESAW